MKIFMVRHGQTNSNKLHKVMGQGTDEPLNETGRAQALEIAEQLKNYEYDVIFASPLKRSIETAQIISQEKNIPIIINNKILERSFGSLSEKTWEEIDNETKAGQGVMREKDFNQLYDYRPFGGESAQEVHNRLQEFVQELKNSYAGKKVLVVAHGGILRAASFLFNKEKIGHIENAELMEFEV